MSDPVVHVLINQELLTVWKYFREDERIVEAIAWKRPVLLGAEVHAGQELAEIKWSRGANTTIVAPDGCEGVITWINRKIKYERLPEWSLSLLLLA